MAFNALIKTSLYTNSKDPRNTTAYPRNPVLEDPAMQYGLGYIFGMSAPTGISILAQGSPCYLTQKELEAAKRPG